MNKIDSTQSILWDEFHTEWDKLASRLEKKYSRTIKPDRSLQGSPNTSPEREASTSRPQSSTAHGRPPISHAQHNSAASPNRSNLQRGLSSAVREPGPAHAQFRGRSRSPQTQLTTAAPPQISIFQQAPSPAPHQPTHPNAPSLAQHRPSSLRPSSRHIPSPHQAASISPQRLLSRQCQSVPPSRQLPQTTLSPLHVLTPRRVQSFSRPRPNPRQTQLRSPNIRPRFLSESILERLLFSGRPSRQGSWSVIQDDEGRRGRARTRSVGPSRSASSAASRRRPMPGTWVSPSPSPAREPRRPE